MKGLVPSDRIERVILEFRGVKVMLDQDLAELYEVETKYLKRQVKRNIERFPEDFMFELSNEEFEILRRQLGTSSWGGTRYAPMAFTEQGIAQLSGVLNSPRAIAVNIQIIRLFTRMRELLSTHKELLLQLEKLRGTVSHNSHDIKVIFNILKRMQEEEQGRALLAQVAKKRPPIGFKKGRP
ncbi:MAG: ORF6N domain-containing protein [Flavobacteriales bacterium]